jgi:Ca2+-binding RTX toxin-like protein
MARRRTRSKARLSVFAGVAAAAALAFPGAASADVGSQVVNGDLVVTSDAGDALVITDVGGQVKVNGADPLSGAAASATIDSIAVTGGPGANNIDLKGVNATAFPLLTSVTVDGGGGNDTINGSQLADVLDGGAGNDQIIGDDNPQNTFDVMRGQAGDDTLVWNPGDDDDINEGGAGDDTSEVNGGGKEQFEVKPSATAGRVLFERVQPNDTFLAPFKVDISDDTERLDLNAGGGDDIVNSAAGLDALGFALDIDGGDGNDTIDGGDGADLLSGGNGNDQITADDNPVDTQDVVRGGDGDDTMVWNGGDDNDVNEGGPGNDTTEVNGAAVGEQFTVKPSLVTAGGVRFDRTGPTPPGPFNIENSGDTERLHLKANGGEDSVTADPGFSSLRLDVEGGDGNDTIDGGDAADLLSGGPGNDRLVGDDNPLGTRDDVRGDAGDDTMVWNPGDDDDINEGGDGNDTVEVNGGGGPEDFEVKPSSVAGRVSFDRTGPTPPGPFNIDIGTSEHLVLNAGGGDDEIVGSDGLAGLIASTFNGDDGNDRIVGTDGEDVLSGGKGHDVIRSRDKAADQVDGNDGFDLAKVDKRDSVRNVEKVIGGGLRVRHLGGKAITVTGNVVAVRLQSVGAGRSSGRVALVRGGKSLGAARYSVTRKAKTVRIKLNHRGRRLLARASRKGLSARLQIDAHDAAGNGWRTSARITLKH